MLGTYTKVATYNLAILLFVSLPVMGLTTAVLEVADLGRMPVSFRRYTEYFVLYYIVDFVPFAIGGLIHQLLWLYLSRLLVGYMARIVAYLASPIIAVMPFLLWQADLRAIQWFIFPTATAMALYVILLKPFPCGDVVKGGA